VKGFAALVALGVVGGGYVAAVERWRDVLAPLVGVGTLFAIGLLVVVAVAGLAGRRWPGEVPIPFTAHLYDEAAVVLRGAAQVAEGEK
jgi:hypothetical protein